MVWNIIKMAASRITFEEIYMSLAIAISKRSTCSRLQVGTVITSVDFRQVLALGYNGTATGMSNECTSDSKGGCICCHSEMNAITNCTCERQAKKLVFVTYNPCITCSQLLVNLGGVQKVYYLHDYRITTGLDILKGAGIEVVKWNDVFEPILPSCNSYEVWKVLVG